MLSERAEMVMTLAAAAGSPASAPAGCGRKETFWGNLHATLAAHPLSSSPTAETEDPADGLLMAIRPIATETEPFGAPFLTAA